MEKELKVFADEVFEKIASKMRATAERNPENIPYISVQGRYGDYRENICWWTNGFWPGLMWLMYMGTGEGMYREIAERAECSLDEAFKEYDGLHHDVGFLWHISSGLNYRLTGNPQSRVRALLAANLLMGRYNVSGDYIRAWNDREGESNIGWAIIDCMMNLSLLYWASQESKDPRYAYVAKRHADKTLAHHVREDGSVKHIVVYDSVSGEEIDHLGGQGYNADSSWSRGQAWGLYGFVNNFEHTGDLRYLNAAKKIAHYVISNVSSRDWLPLCDFRAPKEPVIYDSTAGAIAASGLIELAGCVSEEERELYLWSAGNILKAMEERFCNWNEQEDGILTMGTVQYHGQSGRHVPIVYGDYFFTEAISKLRGNEFRIW